MTRQIHPGFATRGRSPASHRVRWRCPTSGRQAARLPADGPLSVVRASEVTVVGRKGSPVQDGSGRQVPRVQAPKPKSLEPYAGIPSSLYDEGPIGLCYFDLDLSYVDINERLAAVNGLAVKEHLGRTIGDVVPDVARGVEEKLRQVITTGEPIEAGIVEARTSAHPGIMGTFQHNFYPVRSPDGTVVGVSCAVQDVTKRGADVRDTTDRKQIEEQLGQSVAALEVANRELGVCAAEAQAAGQDGSGVCGDVADWGHDGLGRGVADESGWLGGRREGRAGVPRSFHRRDGVGHGALRRPGGCAAA